MDRAWQRYLDVAGGITQVTRNRAEQVVRTLVQRGEIAAERTEKTVDELLRRSEQNRKALSGIVRNETERAVARLGLARQADVERLERKVARLEDRGAAPARKTSNKTSKKASKKSAGKKASKRAPARAAKKASPGGGSS